MACPKKRKCPSVPPSQWLISDFYAPRSGISKEAVNFKVKTPERLADVRNSKGALSTSTVTRKQEGKNFVSRNQTSADRSECTTRVRSNACSSNTEVSISSTVPYDSCGSTVDTLSLSCRGFRNSSKSNTIPIFMSFRSTKSKRQKIEKSGPTHLETGQNSEATIAECSSTVLSPRKSLPRSTSDCFIMEQSTTLQACNTDTESRNLHATGLQNCEHQVEPSTTLQACNTDTESRNLHANTGLQNCQHWVSLQNTSEEKDSLSLLPCSSSAGTVVIQSDKSEETNRLNASPNNLLSDEDSLWNGALDDSELLCAVEELESSQEHVSPRSGNNQAELSRTDAFMFGLLGTDLDGHKNVDDEEEKINLFSRIPDEVIENIFCQLPIMDLLLNCALVCRQWKAIISDEKFIPWKKRYYKLKKEDRGTQDSVVRILDDNSLYEEELLPYYLARFMKNFRRGNSVSLRFLKEHPKFCLIESFLATLVPTSEQEPSPWSVIGLLTLIASTVEDVTHVITCMEKSSACLVHDVIECLYCLATVYFALQMQNRVNPGLHYRVFYALYLYENKMYTTLGCSDSAGDSNHTVGGQPVMKYRCPSDGVPLTHEQLRVVKHKILPGELVKIVAFAGTGKTTTLVQLAQRNPGMKFLNLAYNSAVQQQAEKIFPPNVTCKTTHAWAYKFMWKRYQHKLEYGKFGTGKITNILTKCHFLHARRVEETLNNFIASSDAVVTDQHVPPRPTITVEQSLAYEALGDGGEGGGEVVEEYNYYDTPEYIRKVVQDVAYLWRRMSNPRDKDVRITHDGYLKVYQLSKPTITGFDCLLIDEAQDCTPAASDIFLRQRCSKILVGDPNQQIYGFRGARNAMREAQGSSTYFLTQSFRFGAKIAYVAATILSALKGETRNTLVGCAKDSGVAGDQIGQLAIITRSNFTLFNEASRIACEDNKLKIVFAGGLDKFGLDRVLDIHKLFTAGNAPTASLGIKDNLIKHFKSFRKFKTYCRRARDAELLGKIKIVETHHVMLPERVAKIRSKNTSHMEQADIVLSTVHKAKGLEFDTVRITDDFIVSNELNQAGNRDDDERNLLYVAVTRAKKRLQLTRLLVKVLAEKKEFFLQAVSPQKALEASTTVTCIRCKEEHDFSASKRPHIAVERPQITLGNGDKIQGGILCPSCTSRNIGYLGCMVFPEGHQPVV